MKALCIPSSNYISPFGDLPGEIPVGSETLSQVQDRALEMVGLERVDRAPAQEPYLVFGEEVWFTAALLRLLMQGEPGRLHVEDEAFWSTTGPLQRTPSPRVYAIGLHPGGQSPLESLPLKSIDLGLRDYDVPPMHPQMAHAMRPIRVGAAMVHQVDHWTHIVRVNHLALAAEAEAAWVDWQSSSFLRKARTLGALIWQSRGWQESQILRSLSKIHPEAKVHPSAVVEASRIGPGVRIGPMAVVRNSVLGANTRVEEHATVVMSSLGDGCHVGRYGLVNMCTAWAGARISSGGGYQCCVFGRDSFIAWGATVLDLSFGGEVKVLDQGAKVSSGHHFMGAAIGHDACLGNGVRINHGMEVPCGSVLVAGADDLLRRWPEDTPQSERYRVHRGRPEPVKKG